MVSTWYQHGQHGINMVNMVNIVKLDFPVFPELTVCNIIVKLCYSCFYDCQVML